MHRSDNSLLIFDEDLDYEELLEEEEEEEEENEEDDDEEEEEEKSFSQAEVNRIMSREKKAGRRSGVKSVLEELGVSSLDELKEKLEGSSDEEDEDPPKKDKNNDKEAERARKRQAKADEAEQEAKRERTAAKVERRLLRGDANPKRLDHLVKLVEIDELFDADNEEIDDVIADLKDEVPEFFLEDEDEEEDVDRKRHATPKTNPGGPPRKKSQPSADDRARSRLLARHGSKIKSKSD